MRLRILLCFMLCLSLPAHALQVCGWLIETTKADNVHALELWLSTDGKMDVLYKIGGESAAKAPQKLSSATEGTLELSSASTSKLWSFAPTLSPSRKIDVTLALHQKPKNQEVTPVVAKFSFQRDVPASETKAPPTLAKKQCVTAK